MQENRSIAISCRGVHKHFGDGTRVQALRGVDFEARLGELTFIVGPSGCGKTTLLSVITGLLDPSEGEVELFGSSAGRLPANQRILFRRENVGFVFQQFNLLPALTAAENAAVPLMAAGMKRMEAVGVRRRCSINWDSRGGVTRCPPRCLEASSNAWRSRGL